LKEREPMVESQLAFAEKFPCQGIAGLLIAQAAGWLTFLNRLQIAPKPVEVYDQLLVDFTNFMKVDRGLSPITVEYRCRSVRPFLDRLFERKQSLETITVSDLDSLLAEKPSRRA
jgi:hypothetical protein